MSERNLRLILASFMFVILFLPVDPDPQIPPNWLFSLWFSLEALYVICGGTDFGNLIGWIGLSVCFLAVPILTFLNVCLAIFPARRLRVLYRTVLLLLSPLMWLFVIFIVEPYRGIGYWANPVVVSAAALLEVLLIKGQLDQPDADQGMA